MNELNDLWVLLWSHSQNATRVETLEDALAYNRRRYRDNEAADFIPLFVGDRSAVTAGMGHCSPTLLDREFDAIEAAQSRRAPTEREAA